MKKDIKFELMVNIHNDELYKKIQSDSSEEEQQKINAAIESFVSELSIPLIEQVEKVLNSPEAQIELKKRLGKLHT